jgi:hypothetical protein
MRPSGRQALHPLVIIAVALLFVTREFKRANSLAFFSAALQGTLRCADAW